MYHLNGERSKFMSAKQKYPVSEIFTSIQGEGAHLGRLVTFIRLEGCNLRCPWCDTADKAFDIKTDDFLSVEEIVSKVSSDFVVITGGEPTIHPLKELVDALHEKECIVALETNGTNPVPLNWEIDWVTCSPKPPLYERKCKADELKFVCDEALTIEDITKCKHPGLESLIWLQPEGHKPESIQRAITMVHRYPWLRMGVQLHKVLGVE